ncbi:hypothetical protein P8452_74824 [Trifolium repens]|nr:hypothetical protein P8452_74824 [Trifolium repens]
MDLELDSPLAHLVSKIEVKKRVISNGSEFVKVTKKPKKLDFSNIVSSKGKSLEIFADESEGNDGLKMKKTRVSFHPSQTSHGSPLPPTAGCFIAALLIVLFVAKNWTLRGLCIGFTIFLGVIWILQETTEEEETNHIPPSKQINLISCDGVMFEVDYDVAVALMSHRSKDINTEATYVCQLGSKMMIMMIEYCKAHKHGSATNYFEIRDWVAEFKDVDAEFTDVDPKTLLDYTTCVCYMKISRLAEQTWRQVEDLIKGKTPEQIAEIFS